MFALAEPFCIGASLTPMLFPFFPAHDAPIIVGRVLLAGDYPASVTKIVAL